MATKLKGNKKNSVKWICADEDGEDTESGGEVEVMGIEDEYNEDNFSEIEYNDSESGTGSELDSESEAKLEASSWGKKKKDFYDGGSSDLESEEDDWSDVEMQDEEAQKIQESRKKRLEESDFGVEDIIHDSIGDNYDEVNDSVGKDQQFDESFSLSIKDADSLLEGFSNLSGKTSGGDERTESERFGDKSAELGEEELRNLKSELDPILENMREKVGEVRERVQVLLDFLKTDGGNSLVTEKGLDYLDSKNTLLVMYIGYLCYYIMLKVSPGVDIKNHPILLRLVTLRTMMEKLKSIDVKLQPQIDRMLKLAEKSQQVDEFLTSAPRLDRFALDDDDESDNSCKYNKRADVNLSSGSKDIASSHFDDGVIREDESTNFDSDSTAHEMTTEGGLYVAPKNIPVEFNSKKLSKTEKMMKELERERQRLLKTDIIRQMKLSLSDAPEVVGMDEEVNENSPQLERLQRKIQEKIEFEEGNMMRLPRTKKDRKDERLYKKLMSKVESGVNSLEDLAQFAERAVDLATDSKKNSLSKYLSNASRLNREIAKSYEMQQGSDKSITEKLAKRIKNKAELNIRNKYKPGEFDDSDNESPHQIESNVSDHFSDNEYLGDVIKYKQEKRLAKLSRKSEFNKRNMPNVDDLVDSGQRRASTQEMIKNKGLTRKRKKIEGNARVHNRLKYKKAVKRLKSVQRGVREYENSYSGESKGLKDNIKRSTSLA